MNALDVSVFNCPFSMSCPVLFSKEVPAQVRGDPVVVFCSYMSSIENLVPSDSVISGRPVNREVKKYSFLNSRWKIGDMYFALRVILKGTNLLLRLENSEEFA